MKTITCPIWEPDFMAKANPKLITCEEGNIDWADGVLAVNSERAGGQYKITQEARLSVRVLNGPEKARLTSWLIDQQEHGVATPLVTTEIVEDVRTKRSLPVHERAERLLRLLAEQAESVGTGIDVHKTNLATYAWSESIEWKDVVFFFNYLRDSGWLTQGGGYDVIDKDTGLVQGLVTVAGYSRIAKQAANIDSSQAFVAMWLDEKTDKAYDKGIAPATETAGFKPYRIDREQSLEKIDDKIIAEIRRSRFLVADMTHGGEGARGSVYFEAGFAQGLGIPVIFTCRDDMFSKLPFDTRQYPHIGWKKSAVDSLCFDLENRIRALIGSGPHAKF